jgi:hypothetical protein
LPSFCWLNRFNLRKLSIITGVAGLAPGNASKL